MAYELSRFTVNADGLQERVFLFNTLTRACILVGRETWDRLCHGMSLSEDIERGLSSMGFIVSPGFDEMKLFQYWLNRYRYNTEVMDFTILTTYACNLRCTYCYEGEGAKTSAGASGMSLQTADQLSEWFEAIVRGNHPKTVEVGWFGGEPLMNKQVIEYLSPLLSRACSKHGAQFIQGIVTNGTLVDERTALMLKDLGIASAQVTLDGPQCHDQRRITKTGGPTFHRTVQSIQLLVSHGFRTVVNITLDMQNEEDIYNLIDFLDGEGLKDRIAVNVGEVFPSRGNRTYYSRYCHPSSYDQYVSYNSIAEYARGKGFRMPDGMGKSLCPRESEAAYIIDPLGDVYKCISSVGQPEFRIGSVTDDLLGLYRRSSQLTALDVWSSSDDCKSCAFLPLCRGGCRHHSLVLNGDLASPWCRKDVYETAFMQGLRNRYQNG